MSAGGVSIFPLIFLNFTQNDFDSLAVVRALPWKQNTKAACGRWQLETASHLELTFHSWLLALNLWEDFLRVHCAV
jgi:hypothetical protein